MLQNFREGTKIHSNTAYLTFVAVDNNGLPVKAMEVIPDTTEEKRRFDEALIRRENRLKTRIKNP